MDSGRPDAGPAPLEVAAEFVVPDTYPGIVGLGSLDDGALVLLGGDDLVVVEADGSERFRKERENAYYTQAWVAQDEILMLEQAAAGATSKIARYDEELALVAEVGSPNGPSGTEMWAPGAEAIWLLAHRSKTQPVFLAEMPDDGPVRNWENEWGKSITPRAGLATAAGVPLFVGECVTEPSMAAVCVLRVDPATDELSSVDLDVGHSLLDAWMVETPEGVLVLFWRGDGMGHTSFHGALVDPDDLSIVSGPAQLFDNVGENIKGLAALGDYAYVSTSEYVFRFHVPTMSGWTRYSLQFPPGEGLEVTDDSYNHGVAVLHGKLYHYVGVYLGFGSGVLVQQLVPPPP